MDIKQVKSAIKNKTQVKHQDCNYIVTKLISTVKNDEWVHSLELKDLKAKCSVVIANIERVELIEGS